MDNGVFTLSFSVTQLRVFCIEKTLISEQATSPCLVCIQLDVEKVFRPLFLTLLNGCGVSVYSGDVVGCERA